MLENINFVRFYPMSNPPPNAVLPPHPELSSYYQGAPAKTKFLRDIFDATASDYDRVERVLALGSGRWYRRQALLRSGLMRDMRVLDVATGTGLVAREAIDIVGPAGQVIGVDPSAGMLGQTKSLIALKKIGRASCRERV